jgi:hypothetical protein
MEEKITNTKMINYFEIKPIEGKCMYTTFKHNYKISTFNNFIVEFTIMITLCYTFIDNYDVHNIRITPLQF